MTRPKQNLPRSFREPRVSAKPQAASRSARRRRAQITTIVAVVAAAILVGINLPEHTSGQTATEQKVDRELTQLLAGMHQHQQILGSPTAPVTLEVYSDLKDPDSRTWFLQYLPAIVHDYVRTVDLKLQYRSYKTNTFSPQEFVKEQTAALAAGAQNKLWNFIDTFYHEQGKETATYVTESYLENIARQTSGLNIQQWHIDRHTERREEQTTAEDQTARTLELHVTPSFRIGRTPNTMHNYSGHIIIIHGKQHPIALPDTEDIHKVLKELNVRRH